MGKVKKKAMSAARSETLAAYGFLLPNFLGFLIFVFFAVLASFVLGFVEWDILSPMKFAGVRNFVELLGFHKDAGKLVANDPQFWYYLYNTLFLMLGIPIGMLGSLLLALVMNQKLKGIIFFRTIYFLPTITAGVASCLLWRWLYNPDFGLINAVIAKLGDIIHLPLQGPDWLSSTAWAKPALMIMGLWGAIGGYNMILYLAALQGVPQFLYEAAEIDGANGWQKFWNITFPMITPTTFFIFVMSVIAGFQGGFMAANIMTGGGPAGATTTLSYYIYNNAYQWFKMGYAASIAWFLFLLVFVVTLFNLKYG